VLAGSKAWVSIREKGWPTPRGPATAEPVAAGARCLHREALGAVRDEGVSESAPVKGAVARATSEGSPERRLLRAGAAGLSSAEVLSVLLRGSDERSALEEAMDLLVACGDLGGLAGEAPPEVSRLPECDRAAVLAALELARRLAGAATLRMEITRPGRLAGYLYLRFARLDQEVVGAVWLDARRRVIDAREVFRGTFHGAAVESRPILRLALELRAATVIVFHTHPGGDPTPSEQDLVWTSRLNEACQAVGVELLDHLVLAGRRGCRSARRDGRRRRVLRPRSRWRLARGGRERGVSGTLPTGRSAVGDARASWS
jgi:DNA repair protein RadC